MENAILQTLSELYTNMTENLRNHNKKKKTGPRPLDQVDQVSSVPFSFISFTDSSSNLRCRPP